MTSGDGEQETPRTGDSLSHKVYCRCGKPLRIRARREGVAMLCPDHGVVWRYVVPKGGSDKDK
jgi:hypothetical protein